MHRRSRRCDLSPTRYLGGSWLNSLISLGVSTPSPLGGAAPKQEPLGFGISKLNGLKRLSGPPLPPGGTPTPTRSLERLNERLERLAFGRRPEGFNPPPLETYTVTPSAHGDVVRATEEYVRWFRRTYSVTGPEDRVSQPAPGPTHKGVGGGQEIAF